ncbi:MAG: BamA/TamA family outer membrane protein, partial [Sphingomonadaceae bacterium]|nr:BamA/TamA family outer membrane protein [Sphingomonadaceae bacterium]
AAATEVSDTQRYAVVVEGIDGLSGTIGPRFDALSVLRQSEGKPANVAQVDRRARDDADLLDTLLESEGYYDAQVDTAVMPVDPGHLRVSLTVTPGPRYTFSNVQVTGLAPTDGKADTMRAAFGVTPGTPVDAETVIAGEAALRAKLTGEGFPFAKIPEPEIVVDHETRSATLVLAADPGAEKKFGQIRVTGDRAPFGAGHVQTIARFHPGETFDQRQVDDLRRALIATGLISTVSLTPRIAAGDAVDIDAAIEPAPVHTIAGEVGYGTGEGYRVEASWQHRNLIRPEGAVTFRGVAGTKEQLLGAILRMGDFEKRDQVLNARIVASHDVLAAYDANTFEIGANIERQTNIIWQKKWVYSFGGELIASDERDFIAVGGVRPRRTFLIGALPVTLGYDGSNDLLDPTRGFRLSGRLSPELSLHAGAFGYARVQVDASAYQPVGNTVIAGRVRIATIAGASRFTIAPSRLYYAGGGGSVRGFAYQELGPKNALGQPIGGRSLAEFSLEARVRLSAFGGNFGVVPFVDAGNAYTSSAPDVSKVRFGAGLGLRYYSSFGPIRVDVGTPISRRPGEPRIAVYVSLGQAF